VRNMKPSFPVCCVALALGGAMAVLASDPFHERQAAMQGVGDAFKALAAIAKKDAAFDAAVVKKNASTIADNLKAASTLFVAGSGGGESRAKPEVWTDAAAFEKGLNDAHAAAVALQSVTDEAAFGPAQAALGATCKSCHDKYRLPKK
jgi:cytochrome c556